MAAIVLEKYTWRPTIVRTSDGLAISGVDVHVWDGASPTPSKVVNGLTTDANGQIAEQKLQKASHSVVTSTTTTTDTSDHLARFVKFGEIAVEFGQDIGAPVTPTFFTDTQTNIVAASKAIALGYTEISYTHASDLVTINANSTLQRLYDRGQAEAEDSPQFDYLEITSTVDGTNYQQFYDITVTGATTTLDGEDGSVNFQGSTDLTLNGGAVATDISVVGNVNLNAVEDLTNVNINGTLVISTAGTYTLSNCTFTGAATDIENAVNATSVTSYTATGSTISIADQNTEAGDGGWTSSGTYSRRGQTFTGDGGYMTDGRLNLYKAGTPTGFNLTVRLYASTGTCGTNGVPTGAALETSSTVLAVSSLTVTATEYTFTFAGTTKLTNGTCYCLAIEGQTTTGGNNWFVERDLGTPTHSGNGFRYDTAWGSSSADAMFKVNSDKEKRLNGTITAIGQSFAGANGDLTNIAFSLKKSGSPTGNMTAKLFAHSGTLGTSSVPTGSALATSATVAASSLTGTFATTAFQFTDSYTMSSGTNYVAVLEYTGTSTNYVAVETDITTPTASGNYSEEVSSVWSAESGTDAEFSVSTGGLVTIQATNGSNPTTFVNTGTPPGVTVIQNAVTVTVANVTEGTPIAIYANATVGSVTDGDLLKEDVADSTGKITYAHNYEGDLAIIIRARNQGVPVAAIADDNGSYTDETDEANNSSINDMTLLPTTPVVNQDGYLFGHTETFAGIKLWMTTAGVGGGTITWQYWNGAWTSLSGVTDGTSSFSTTGEKKITYTVPGDWATTTINGQGPYYYVRARFTAGSFSTAPKARQCTLDATRYLPFVQNNTIVSTGLSVQAVWTQDTIAQF